MTSQDGDENLKPFSKLPDLNTVCVLIVGAEGIQQGELAKGLIDLLSRGTKRKVKVRIATCLPLPPDPDGSRPRIDFTIFLINQASKQSYTLVRESLSHMDSNFFLGRVLFVMSTTGEPTEVALETETVSTLAEAYNSQVIFADLRNQGERAVATSKCSKLINCAAGFGMLSPTLLS